MKMVKSLLLGSAAGLVAVTAGQAADLPVKAKPVEYVKVCSLYGAGFYYMPGTDMCIKIGGWVRAEASYGINGSMTWGDFSGNLNDRLTSNIAVRARGYITADAREQTAYGTARGYIAVGLSTSDVGLNTAANTFSANRAFVQWAGMTAGLAQSFYDYYSAPAANYRAGNIPFSDTGDGGWWVWAYTAQLGNGVTATISAEDRRTTQIIDADCANITSVCGETVPAGFISADTYNNYGAGATTSVTGVGLSGGAGVAPGNGAYGGWQAPDIVGNLRVDQTWGGAQIMAAAHELNTLYYQNTDPTSAAVQTGVLPYTASLGHPGDQWGYAIGAGLRLNFPSVAQGDYMQTQFNYSQGALRYLFDVPNSNWAASNGAKEAYGVLSDCVYGGSVAGANETSCQLTTGWGVNASYEHYWTPQWHQSLTGWYYAVSYDQSANAMLCGAPYISGVSGGISLGNGGKNGSGFGTGASAAAGCTNNWSTWGIGSRLQWDVTKSFYLGVEVLYSDLHSASPNATGSLGSIGSTTFTPAEYQEADQGEWVATVRAHKDFLP